MPNEPKRWRARTGFLFRLASITFSALPLLLAGCNGRLGRTAFISPRPVPVHTDLIAAQVTVRRCGKSPTIEELIERALAKYGEGNAMMNVEGWYSVRWYVFFKTRCLRLRGDVVNALEREKALHVPVPDLEELISRKCEAEWPDHPLMQEQCLKKELDAYKRVR